MKNPHVVCSLAVSLLFSAAVLSPAVFAANTEAGAAEQAVKVPLESSFEKEKSGENQGLYVLTLKNRSARAIKVNAVVEASVTTHNRPKSRTLPVQEIAADKTWKIDGLAAHDKVVLTSPGFAPLILIVP